MKYLKNKKFKFGKYKGQPFSAAKDDTNYLRWLLNSGKCYGQLLLYLKLTLNEEPKYSYRVRVEDAVNVPDGTYTVLAHSKDHAISIVRYKYKIQISQSGTTFSSEKI